MTHHAKKVVIISEKIILEPILAIIEELGASGYTVTPTGGKGSRGMRSADRASVIEAFSNVKIEVITTNDALAEKITDRVTEELFCDYSGITFLENVEIIRPDKFTKA